MSLLNAQGRWMTPQPTSSLGEHFNKIPIYFVSWALLRAPPHRRAVPDKHARAPQRESRRHPYLSFPNRAPPRARGRGRGHECLVRGL